MKEDGGATTTREPLKELRRLIDLAAKQRKAMEEYRKVAALTARRAEGR